MLKTLKRPTNQATDRQVHKAPRPVLPKLPRLARKRLWLLLAPRLHLLANERRLSVRADWLRCVRRQ